MKLERMLVKIENQSLVFKSEYHKKMFKRFLGQYEDKQVYLEITEKKSKRSKDQNAYYWLYLGIIAEDTGYTTEELHALFSGMFLSEIKEVMGKTVRIKKSTAKLTVGEFCEYLADISAETGIPLPDTTEYWGYSYHK